MPPAKTTTRKRCDPHWPKCMQPRQYWWYGIFIFGLPLHVCFCIWFAIDPPDREVFWAKMPVESRQELFFTHEDAVKAGASDIWNYTNWFRGWFALCAFFTSLLWFVGMLRNSFLPPRYRHRKLMKYSY